MSNQRVTCTITEWGSNGAFKAVVKVDDVPVVKSYHATRKDAEAWCEKEIEWRSKELRE